MRQQSQSQHQSLSGYTNESFESRKQRIDKKRAIRKNKVGFTAEETPNMEDKRFLTKQQKMQIQKAKNRQAAQKSRDQHKKFVDDLMQQNRLLKEELSKPRYCSKCSKEVFSQTEDSSDPSVMNYSNHIHINTFIQNQKNQELNEFQSPFIRMNDYQDSSPLRMFLFIAMIMLGLFLMGGSNQGLTVEGVTLPKRDLMQVGYQNNGQIRAQILENSLIQTINEENQRLKQIQQINKFDLQNQIANSFNMEDDLLGNKIMTQVVPLSNQLSPLNQQNCIKSIIEKNYTELTKVTYTHPTKINSRLTSLRSNYINQMELFTSSFEDSDRNLLFCSLPKLYRKTQEVGSNLLSKFIDIVISGSEMMEVLGKSPNLWMNKMVNFKGIYKINAEVKEIVQIEDGNCIL